MGDEDAEDDERTGREPVPSDGGEPVESESGGQKGLRRRMLDDLRHGASGGAAAGAHAAATLGHAAEATRLEIATTGLHGPRSLVGHVLGMHLLLPASGIHGPRESPALVYLFADALAVRPTDDAPMSTVPAFGLHLVLPPLAVARWVYKAGRIEHANLDLVKDAQRFEESLATWTVDDFADADPKLEVYRASEMPGPLHVYQHLGFAYVWVPTPDRPTRLKSALPVTSEAFVKLWGLFTLVSWSRGLSTEVPAHPHVDAPAVDAPASDEPASATDEPRP